MNQERLYSIVLSHHLSEKASLGMDTKGQYVFKVLKSATKPEIKQAVESIFNTKVKAVRVVNEKPKARRFGQIVGKTKAVRKAYVTLMPGEKIDLSVGK